MGEGSALDRRQALAALAAVAVVRWTPAAAATPVQAPLRVRAGAPVDLFHPEASAFRLEFQGLPPVDQPAPRGRLRFRAPEGLPGFTALRCTPLSDGQPVAAQTEVAVLSGKVLFGA